MLKQTLKLTVLSLLASFAGMTAAQAVMYPIPEPQSEPKLVQDYPVFVNRAVKDADYEKALRYADEGLKKNPRNVGLLFKRGTILEALGRKDEAEAVYRQMITQYPEIPEPYNNLAVLVADSGRGDLAHAAELLERAITANPRFYTAHENLGDIYAMRALQNYKDAQPSSRNHANRALANRVAEKISLLQIVTGNEASENSSRKTGSAAPAASEDVQKNGTAVPAAAAEKSASAAKAKAKAPARKNAAPAKTVTKTVSGKLVSVTTVNGIRETVERAPAPQPAAAAEPQTKSTLIRPLPELK